MATRKLDENGNYRQFDLQKNEFVDEPLASNIGQIEHQTVATTSGRIIDHDEIKSDVVDENGLAVISQDEEQIKQFIKEAISVDNLVSTFHDNSHETLLKLLAIQDNKHPLKKGGIGIAYRTDALIMHCKMEFTAEENVVFDAILGTMSTYPENDTYIIKPSDFIKLQRYKNERTLYNAFKNGSNKLKNRFLVFDELGPDGEDEIVVPWFEILRHHGKKKEENSFIEFRPSAFFKDLALCSQLVHGAYGTIEVTTQLKSKYTIAMYWFLESRKKYREYPGARAGVFEMSIEEVKAQFNVPESYKPNDITRKLLKEPKAEIDKINECDFTFDYEVIKDGSRTAGYRITVNEKRYIEASDNTKIVDADAYEIDPLEEQIKTFMSLTGVDFTSDNIHQIYLFASKYNRDAAFIMQAASVFKTRNDNKTMPEIENPLAYVLSLIKSGSLMDITKAENEYKAVKTQFNNFSQRDYDFTELENIMLNKE